MMKYKKLALHAVFLLLMLCLFPKIQASAEELPPVIVKDSKANTITITAKNGGEFKTLYIKWDDPVTQYQIMTDAGILECGKNGFIHEFIVLPQSSKTVTVLLPKQQMRIYKNEVRLFTDEEVPDDVQIWEPPHDRADIMLIPSHSDDEILFMGGIAPTYGSELGARVQVVYMTEFYTGLPVREHEKLDGLWTNGVRHYPVCGNFRDFYCKNLDEAVQKYDYQAVMNYLTETIRRFKPQILVTHDFNGEYGHGFHILTAKAAAEALEKAADPAYSTGSNRLFPYSAWNTPKAYFHLYWENKIEMDLRRPLLSMGGKTALDVAKESYKKHVTQQRYDYYVSDDYAYSCARFGLYRTTVGLDTGNSMLENIVLYDEQERLAEAKAKSLSGLKQKNQN